MPVVDTMDTKEEYKYDVAFSFLQQDELLATRLNELLRERMSTFIYSEKQLEIAGKDGEVMLKKAFGLEARIVVILYRKEWGTTPWTRIEEDSIRDRAYEHGYDFCLLIPLDEPPTKPEWYPKNRIWLGFKRYGIESLSAVIEARVEEAGGTAREETLADRNARLQRQIAAAEKRKGFLSSQRAVKPADEEARKLFDKLKQAVPSLTSNQIPLTLKQERKGVSLSSCGFILQVSWHRTTANVLDDSGLFLRLMEIDRRDHFDSKYHELRTLQFQFDMSQLDDYGWRATHEEKKFFTSDQLADYAMRMLIDKVAEYRLRKLN